MAASFPSLYPTNRDQLFESLKGFAFLNRNVEPTHVLVSDDTLKDWRMWSRDQCGGPEGVERMRNLPAGNFLGINVELSDEFRLENRCGVLGSQHGWSDDVQGHNYLVCRGWSVVSYGQPELLYQDPVSRTNVAADEALRTQLFREKEVVLCEKTPTSTKNS